jgi:hypothetical protein
LALKKKLKPVEGVADEDIKEMKEADQIRLRNIGYSILIKLVILIYCIGNL